MIGGCSGGRSDDGDADAALSQTTMADLSIKDVKVGDGETAAPGRTVRVHYTGWLYHPTKEGNRGRQFDSSREGREPFEFRLGEGNVIPGWDQGVAGMKVGGTRVLVIPARLAYGPQGAGNGVIPPNATLVFEVELVGVQ
jgi:FKBP-type peptidyl-prolyl cis-trans isomerase FkpA